MTGRVARAVEALAGAVDRAHRRVLSWNPTLVRRLTGAAVGIPALAVIGLARWLEPDPRGFGTHVQLGLGACSLMQLTGYPCPMCGMTTTFSLLAHGRVLEAFANQPFGPVLFAGTAAAAVLGIADLALARGVLGAGLATLGRWERTVAWALLGGLGLGWIYKIVHVHPELLRYLPHIG